MVKLKIKRLTESARMPEYAHKGDAGMDIFSDEAVVIAPNKRALIKTGVSIAIPEGYVALVWDKSGVALSGVTRMAGVIDAGYRGEYKILLHNLGEEEYRIDQGQKIAQILIQKVENPEVVEVDDLSDSERGSGSFGSTGLK